MPRPFLDAQARHPVTLPDGTVHPGVAHLPRVIDHPNIEVGEHSYCSDFAPVTDYAARIAHYLHPGAPERLRIGRFVQIAHGARIVTSSANHPMGGFSTYPFLIFRPETLGAYAQDAAAFPDTEIGHDVWLGDGATVLPGARIGSGAIVGAGAVVGGEIPPYAVVAGNPARILRMRFPPETVAALLEIRWWDRPLSWIEANHALIAGSDIAALRAAARGGEAAPANKEDAP
jgi:virginiamycin A acetyltransferase